MIAPCNPNIKTTYVNNNASKSSNNSDNSNK